VLYAGAAARRGRHYLVDGWTAHRGRLGVMGPAPEPAGSASCPPWNGSLRGIQRRRPPFVECQRGDEGKYLGTRDD
jgi:hypothetical protein